MPSAKDRLFSMLSGGFDQGAAAGREGLKANYEASAAAQKRAQNRADFDELRLANPKDTVSVGGDGNYSVSPKDDVSKLLAMLRFGEVKDEHDRKAVQELEDRSTKAGTAPAIESLKRAENAIPGVATGAAKFKSVGGIKTLAPNFTVPLLEKVGLLDSGASDERAALQELSNAKIYDSSGKQINEAEMRRIQDAMGLRGVFSPDTINQAMKQYGDTVFQKQNQVSAGADPKALQTFKGRGGLAGFGSLQEMLGKGAPPPAAGPSDQPEDDPNEDMPGFDQDRPPSQETEEQEYLRLKAKHKPGAH
jgi:hypothetical protein